MAPPLDTVEEIASIVRFIADDQEAIFLDTAVQMPAIRSGYREFQRRMALRDVPFMSDTAVLSLPVSTTALSFTSTPALPDDFNFPLELHEKQTGQSGDYFDNHEMYERSVLPDIIPDFYLRYWVFQAGVIKLLGSTVPIDIRLRYARVLPDLQAETDTIPVPFAADAIAWLTLVMVGLARGVSEEYRQRCDVKAEYYLDELTAIHVKRDQLQRRHRRPHLAGRF